LRVLQHGLPDLPLFHHSRQGQCGPDRRKEVRIWDACHFEKFAKMAGGFDIRPDKLSRLKHRLYDKFYYPFITYGEGFCVGCGRCIRHCQSEIDIRDALREVAMNNPYIPKLALIKDITEESRNIRTLTVAFKDNTPFDPQPGQFVELSLFGYGEFPVSIAGVLDPAAGIFQTTIRRMGGVTERIADLKVNSTVGVRGPFGKGYPVEKLDGKDIVLVAGGMGIASIKYLADCLIKKRSKYGRLILLYGAATPADLIYRSSRPFPRLKQKKSHCKLWSQSMWLTPSGKGT